MVRRSFALVALVLALALPMSASQFLEQSFDEVAGTAKYIVRGQIVDTWSAWDDSREVIYTYATLRVNRYFGDTTGPDTLVIRNVGGTVDGYTQEAIGFPAVRRGERVVFMLSDAGDSLLQIHAYNQGKYLVRDRAGVEVLIADPVRQGEGRPQGGALLDIVENAISADTPAMSLDEFERMVDDARAGVRNFAPLRDQQN
jgi:hypothetical protein